MSKSLAELIQEAPLPDVDPCVESYIKICCEHGEPFVCYESSENAVAGKAGGAKKSCGDGTGSVEQCAATAILKAWPKADVFELIDKLRAK